MQKGKKGGKKEKEKEREREKEKEKMSLYTGTLIPKNSE